MNRNIQEHSAAQILPSQYAPWYDIKSLGDLAAQGGQTNFTVTNCYTKPQKHITAQMVRYASITKQELYRIGENEICTPLALYKGKFYKMRKPYPYDSAEKDVYLLDGQLIRKNAIQAIYAACFDVRYKYVWYRCSMVGGTDENHVSVVVEDPCGYTGLVSAHSRYMWGNGVELEHDQIEAVRLCISDPITAQYFH